jgi:hypothetical protein
MEVSVMHVPVVWGDAAFGLGFLALVGILYYIMKKM